MVRRLVLAAAVWMGGVLGGPGALGQGQAEAGTMLAANQAAIDRGLKFAGIHGVPLMVFTWDEFIGNPPSGMVSAEVIALMREAVASRPYVTWCGTLGVVNILDFLCFQGLVSSNDPAADCNNDGVINIFDFLCFQGAVTKGCD